MKHTKGKWVINGLDIATDCKEQIPVVANLEDSVTNEANQALIAAAPEMLEALEVYVNFAPNPEAEAVIRALIAKAKGGE